MKKQLLFTAFLLVSLPLLTAAQSTETNNEETAVRQAVNIYLTKKDPELIKSILSPDAKIISIESSGKRILETPINTPSKDRKDATVSLPAQKIVAIDVTTDGASVKVESEFPSDVNPTVEPRKHIQYISLLKLKGEWKIVSILMPPFGFAQNVNKN